MHIVALLAVLAAAGAIIWFQVIPRLRNPAQVAELKARLDAIRASLWTRIWARVQTWKTVILGFLGTAWVMLPDIVQQLQGAPWTEWLDASWARLIGAVLYLTMILTKIHSPGPTGVASVMPPGAPGTDVLVPEAVKVALIDTAKQEGKI